MTVMRGKGTANALWATLAREGADANLGAAVQQGLMEVYLGERYYTYSGIGNENSGAKIKPLVDAAKQKVESGPEMQRLVALALLASYAPQEAVAPAEKIVQDRPADDPLRADAFRVVLLTKPAHNAEAAAVGRWPARAARAAAPPRTGR